MLHRKSSRAGRSGGELGAQAQQVVIAGGGVAALETALALQVLAGERVRLTLLAPTGEFVYRPVAVLEPFVGAPPRRLALAKVAADLGATLELDHVAAVDCDRRVIQTTGKREIRYDALVVAVGARTCHPPLPGVLALDVSRVAESLDGLMNEIADGLVQRVAFVAPRPAWPLPAYELALLSRRRAREHNVDLGIAVITAEQQPLEVFGENVSVGVRGLLAGADIQLMIGTRVEFASGRLVTNPGARALRFDRVVTIPELVGPAVRGLPANADGFLPVTSHGAVIGVERVYAAGDATYFPIKFGGIAARQADAVASSIAARAGAPIEPKRFDGTIHGVLIGDEPGNLYFTTRTEAGLAVDSRTSDTSQNPTWSPEAKLDAHYLGAYLDQLWSAGPPWRRVGPAR